MEVDWRREYYKEADPLKRKRLLQMGIEEEGETEENKIRQELYGVRYAKPSDVDKRVPADSFLALWMTLEYNKDVGGGLFGLDIRRAQKEIRKKLSAIKVQEYLDQGGLYESLMRAELEHMVRVYMSLSLTDHSYGSTLFGLMKIGEDHLKDKLREDVRSVRSFLPVKVSMEQELSPVGDAIAAVYDEFFPLEGGVDG